MEFWQRPLTNPDMERTGGKKSCLRGVQWEKCRVVLGGEGEGGGGRKREEGEGAAAGEGGGGARGAGGGAHVRACVRACAARAV
jgi:hypothetical protein